MKRWSVWCTVAIAVAACRAPPRPAIQRPSPEAVSVQGLAAAIEANAKRSERESDSGIRSELAAESGRDADACLERAPHEVACLYGRAVALGLEARAHPTRAGELLRAMLESLSAAEAADPAYDEAGPARVKSLVLIRAPGWPLGPGDPEAGLAAGRRAVSLRPRFAPNQLALAEALAKSGDPDGARQAYLTARDLAQALPAAPDRDEWLREADEGLRRR